MLKLHDRVIAKANPQFAGVVIEAAADGESGYVRFDGDEESGRTYFHASELEPETKAAPAPALKAEPAPAREIAPPPPMPQPSKKSQSPPKRA